jgi:alkaline phosphatase D
MNKFRNIIAVCTKGFFILLVATPLFLNCQQKKVSKPDKYVVMLSLDAFRWDYPELAKTPNLNRLANIGVKAEALIPCYPTKTFPNHYSMATGLHPDNHGIVSNRFFDSTLGYYSIGNRKTVENAAFYGGEPIWVTAEKQGIKAATYYWVGSEAPVGGTYPTFWKRYEQNVPFENRIDTVIHWLSLPEEQRPRLICWYYHEPDWTAHKYGSTSKETLLLVEKLDSLLGVFFSRIEQLPIASKINLVVVSDHGMADISPEKYYNLKKIIDTTQIEIITGGNPVFTIKPKPGFKEKVLADLKTNRNLKVWTKDEIPARLHFGSNPRIQDIVVEAELGYSIGLREKGTSYNGAAHGYDNIYPEMHGIFYASGPDFKHGFSHKAFLNTNLYVLIAHILGLEPVKTDGDWNEVKDMLVR